MRATALLAAVGVILLGAAVPAPPVVDPVAAAMPSAFSDSGTATGAEGLVERADRFVAGDIISDDAFYRFTAMDADGVQRFLEGVDCRPSEGAPCAADLRVDAPAVPAAGPGHCDAFPGGEGVSAAEVIADAAMACRINPQVLLVLLQKEQSLLTRPTPAGYERATGYACPDTADCDADYLGFVNQVYNAAWQFRQYTVAPDRAYRIGSVPIGFHPDPACGAGLVAIENQATANLYNYTPYQPNAAALASPDVGDDCSTFGNLNFFLLFDEWFGDPVAERFHPWLGGCLLSPKGASCPRGSGFELIRDGEYGSF